MSSDSKDIEMIEIIIIAIFTPRGVRFTAVFSANGHVDSLRGGFNLETFQGHQQFREFRLRSCCRNAR